MINVLYIHGMGGGGDSRIPWLLRCAFDGRSFRLPAEEGGGEASVNVVVRTYDFDPEAAAEQIAGWLEELRPRLVIGESLGSVHAIRIKGVPHLLVSPSLNAPLYFGWLSWLALVPGVTWLFDRIYRSKPGDRQRLHFTFDVLHKYVAHRKEALANSTRSGSTDMFYAFFGIRDHYRKSGVVSVRTWKKYFCDTFKLYDGTHFMEEEFVESLLVPKIIEVLSMKQ